MEELLKIDGAKTLRKLWEVARENKTPAQKAEMTNMLKGLMSFEKEDIAKALIAAILIDKE